MILEAVIALIALCSISLQVFLNLAEDGTVLNAVWQMLRYFTILTNLTIAVVMARAVWSGARPSSQVSAAITTWIIVVAAVYHGLLYQGHNPATLRFWTDQGLHTAVPVLTVVWWVVRADKSGLRITQPVKWAIGPIGYLIYVLTRGLSDGTYPYFFIDPRVTTWPAIAAWVTAMAVLFVALGMVLVALSRIRIAQRRT